MSTDTIQPIPFSGNPHAAIAITRRAVRDFIDHHQPHRPDLQADPTVLALVRDAIAYGATLTRGAMPAPVLPQPPAEHDGIDWRCPGCGLDRWALQRKADHRYDEMTAGERRCYMAQCGRREAWARQAEVTL